MAFNGTEGSPIDQIKAGEWTKRYREGKQPTLSHFFGRDILLKLLSQADCQGIRFYYGFDGEAQQLVAVGADSKENDQLGKSFHVADDSVIGPPHCGEANILNS